MRLWHKDLIKVLPRQQLLGQWRECCCIAKSLSTNGTPNHILVNKILDYPICHFTSFSKQVIEEMKKRGYKVRDLAKDNFRYNMRGACEIIDDFNVCCTMPIKLIYPNWHNDRYYHQCYINLQEKHDCGGITDEEWKKIEENK